MIMELFMFEGFFAHFYLAGLNLCPETGIPWRKNS
jgi:hypothetical protein